MLIQPQEDIKLPADIQTKIEAARNHATLLEADNLRLQKLITSENYTITQLSNQKDELNKKIPVLQAELETAKTELTRLNASLAESKINLGVVNQQITVKNEELQEKIDSLEQSKSAHNVMSEMFAREKKAFETYKAEVLLKEQELKDKFSKLKELIS